MGGRKKTFKVLKKPKLQKPKQQFDCGVCGWKDSIMIKIKKGFKVAKLECERCETKFQMKVRSLDEPIDVYHDWLHKVKTKTITPYPNRLEDDYDLSSEEENCNDVEKYLKPNYKLKQSKRKRIKKNSIEEGEDSVSSQIEVDDDVSEDSLILKQKIEAKQQKIKNELIDDEEVQEQQQQQEDEDEEEKQSSQEYEDSKDESFDVKNKNKISKKPNSKKKK